MATAERNDEAPNSAPLGAMGSLLRKLGMLPCTDDGGSISELKDYIHSIRHKLKKLSEVQDPPLTVNYWMKHARELSYDIEAYLDGLDAQTEDSLNVSDAKEGEDPDDSYAKMKDCINNSDDETGCSVDDSHAEMEDNPDDSDANMEDLIDDDSDEETEETIDYSDSSTQDSICSSDYKISGFRTRAKGMIDRYERFGLDSVFSYPTAATTIVSPRPSGDVVLVGMGNQITKLISLLQPKDENDNQLKMVSILGHEGIGKSTLIQELWRVSFINEKEIWPEPQSDVKIKRAFVRMGKKPDVRMILRSILSQVNLQEPAKDSGVTNLIQDIRKHLEQKRYFIIVDDVQSLSVWDVVGHAFPRCSFGSRVITTTSDKEVALACCSYVLEHSYVMEPLSVGDCKELFIKTVVGFRTVNLQLSKDVSGEIKRKCGGLPLGIMWAAILMASQPEIKEKLRRLETEQRLSKMEKEENLDSDVKKFLDKNLRTESAPVEILNQVLKLCYNSLPHYLKTCLLYLSVYPENYFFLKEDLVKLWIAEGFICTSEEDKVEAAGRYFDVLISLGLIQRMNINCNKQHHQGEVEEDPFRVPYIVHPTVFDFITCKSTEYNFITTKDHSQSTAEFKDKIRRLSLQFGSATYATTLAIIGLSQVRTLSLIGLSRCMPSLVDFKLVRVVILHLWADDEDKKFVLAEIDKLLLLRYLQARCNVSIELTGQIGCLKHLETLEINSVFTTIDPVSDQRFELLPPMVDTGSTSIPSVQIFELLPPICIFSRLPMWIPQLRQLSNLEIVLRELLTTDIDMLADLPALTALSLYVRIPTAGSLVFSRGTFPDLKYFKFMCGVLSLDFQEKAMPNLQRLMIGFNVRRREKYDNILAGTQHLLNLQEVVASIGATMGTGETDRIAAESALKDAINKHQRPTKFNVKRVHQVQEEYHPPPLDPLRINEQEEVPVIHGQQTQDSTNGQPMNLDNLPAEHAHEHANFGFPHTSYLQEDDNTSTQQKSGDNQVKQIRQEGTQKGLSRNIAPLWEDVLHSSSGLPTSSIYQQSDVEYQKNTEYHPPERLDSSDLRIQLSAAKRFLLGPEATIDSPSLNSVLRNRVNSVTDTISAYDTGFQCSLNPDWQTKTSLTFQSNSQGSEMTELFDHGHFEPYSREDTTFALAQTNKFNIREISPEWAFSYEIVKVIITGDFLCDPSNLYWAVMFGDSEVPAEIVQPGVLRCHTPLHSSGNLRICITSGNREVCSEIRYFEFRSIPTSSSFTDIAPSSRHLKSSEELLLLAKFARMLLSGSGSSEVPDGDPQFGQCPKLKMNEELWERLIDELKVGCENPLSSVDWILEELLKSKLQQWLSVKLRGFNGTDSLSKHEQGIIHLISVLGYEWALSSVLSAGVGLNFRDSNGWTALHWAAYFGRERMVAALLAAGASATAVTDPTAQDPVGKTAAFLASERGHTGLAGYLSEVSLTSYLASLTIEESEVEAEKVVENISQRSAQPHGGTEDELSMKDSLAAVRNAAQAAARIQNAFRALSFRKRQQKTARLRDEYGMSQEDIDELAAASRLYHQAHASSGQFYDKAAVSIQKKYKGWKGRKHFST